MPASTRPSRRSVHGASTTLSSPTWLDAAYLHVRERDGHHVTSNAVVIATGGFSKGLREVLGCDVGDSEDETS